MQSFISFVVIFATLVLVHELGHFTVAKLTGVKVHEFSVGFGPPLWRRRRGDTSYSVRAIPLGGYVKLAGMDPAEDAADEVGQDDPGNFYSKPIWARLSTMVAGPVMNFVLAILLYAFIFSYLGVPTVTIANVNPGSPAAEAGLQSGDQIERVGSYRIRTTMELVELIATSPNEEITIGLRRDDERVTLTAVPIRDPETGYGRLGVEIGEERTRTGPIGALGSAGGYTVNLARMIVRFLSRAVTGRVDAEFVGPVGIYRTIQGIEEEAPTVGIFVIGLMVFAAYISVFLALFNLVPIPILDGGWVVLLLLEAVRGRRLSPEQEGIFRLVGLAMVFALFIFVMFQDLFR